MRPKVSFVVPCYNYGRFVAQAVESLLDQTLPGVEIIAIDDASRDNSAGVLARYADLPQVRLVSHQQNQGFVRTLNEGLALASGDYVGIMDADDFCLRRDSLERQVEVFAANPSVGLVYSGYAMLQGDDVASYAVPWPADFVRPGLEEFRHLMWADYIQHSGTLRRRSLNVGPYDPRLPLAVDWDMWLRTVLRADAGYIAAPLYAYRMHQENMSHKHVPPWQATEELLFLLTRAFDALPENAPQDVRGARAQVLRHALFQTPWIDVFHGRRIRTWQGIAYAVKKSPRAVLTREFSGLCARALLMTLTGRDGYRRAAGRLERLRGRRNGG